MIKTPKQTPEDAPAVHRVNALAFERDAEAQLIEVLRLAPDSTPELSLVALLDGEIVGHILFSPIVIETPDGTIPAISLAPMAVLPELQHRGVGSALGRWGLGACRV